MRLQGHTALTPVTYTLDTMTNYGALDRTVRETLKSLAYNDPPGSIAGYVRFWFSDGWWYGDRCGCIDDRCRGYHHDAAADECGCFDSLRDYYVASLTCDEHGIHSAPIYIERPKPWPVGVVSSGYWCCRDCGRSCEAPVSPLVAEGGRSDASPGRSA